MDRDWEISVEIPADLGEVLRQGMCRGKEIAARRARRRRMAARTACSFLLVLTLFAGGVRFSPAFAAAVRELPVVGQLVRAFEKNQPLAQGGVRGEGGMAVLTMERSGDREQIRLEFRQEDAALYQVEFASYPKTITITMPGTDGVEVLSEISRARDTSQYIKSVCQLPTSTGDTTSIQLELESDADVQIQEYRDPGSLVIALTPAEIQLDTVYSVRTLSFDADGFQQAASRYNASGARVLRDDQGQFFLEFVQEATMEQAEARRLTLQGDVIVEARTGNNVPVCFPTMEAYESSCFLNQYYQLLLQSDRVEPVLDFMDRHFANASDEERDTMLRGLAGLLQDYEETVDWDRVFAFYQTAGIEPPEEFQRQAQP